MTDELMDLKALERIATAFVDDRVALSRASLSWLAELIDREVRARIAAECREFQAARELQAAAGAVTYPEWRAAHAAPDPGKTA